MRIFGGTERRVFGGAAERKFVHVGTTNEYRSFTAQFRDDGRIVGCSVVLKHPRGGARALSFSLDVVFDRKRDCWKAFALSLFSPPVGIARLRERIFLEEFEVCVETTSLFRAGKQSLRQFDGGDVTLLKQS